MVPLGSPKSHRRNTVNPWRGLDGLPKEVWLLASATLLNRAGTMALPFLALYATQGMGFSASRAGLAMLVYGAASLVAAPLGGYLSDRIGSLRVMKGSLALSGCLMLLIPFTTSWPPLLGLVALWSLAAESFRPASMAILTDLAPEARRKAVFSLNRLAINLGMSLGPALGGLLARHSYHALFWVDGATALAAALVLRLFTKGDGLRPEQEAHRPTHPFTAMNDRRLVWFLCGVLPAMVVFFQHEGALPVFLVDHLHYSPAFYGSLFLLNTGLILLLEVRLNLATAHWPRTRTLVLGASLSAMGFGALAFTHGRWGIWGTVIVWTFGEMILLPAMSDQVAHFAPAARRGAYMGLFSMTVGLAFALGPWLGLFLMPRMGAISLWLAMGALGLLSALIFARVDESQPATVPGPA